MNTYLSVPEFARRHRVTRATVYLWIANDRIEAKEVDGQLFILKGTKRPKNRRAGRKKVVSVLA